MIISKLNKYFEKHARTTYIILGVIICFAFVIFVTPGERGGGCGGSGRPSTVGEMYGDKIQIEDFMMARDKVSIGLVLRYGNVIDQVPEQYINQETLNRMVRVHEATEGGYLNPVTDAQVAAAIRKFPIFLDDKNAFDPAKFESFKNGFLSGRGMKAEDFDEMVREDLAVEAMEKAIREKAVVTDAEIDAFVTEYGVSYHVMPLDAEGDVAPAQAEIDEFFAKRKAEIVPEKQRAAQVAVCAPSADTKVNDEEIKAEYESGKQTLYTGKTLEQAKDDIVKKLKANKSRAEARERADKLAKGFAAASSKTPDEALKTFKKLAGDAKATVKKIDFFTIGNVLPGMNGSHPFLAESIRLLNEKGKVTPVLNEEEGFVVAILTDIKDGIVPDKLNEEYTSKIKDKLVEEKALAFYKENIAPYKEAVAKSTSIQAILMPEAMSIRNDKSLTNAARREKLMALEEKWQNLLMPFYVPEMCDADFVVFPYSNYMSQVTVSDEEIKKEYEEHKADWEKWGKKTFEEAKSDVLEQLKYVGARKLAMDAAEKFASELAAAWKTSVHDASHQVALFKAAAEKVKLEIRSSPIPNNPQIPMAQAIFKTNSAQPFTGAVESYEGVYVASAKERRHAYLADGAERIPTLKFVYGRSVSSGKTETRAKELLEKLNNGDKQALEATAFTATKLPVRNPQLGQKGMEVFSELQFTSMDDAQALYKALATAKEKQVFAPFKTESGYVLVRMDSKTIPSGDAAKTDRESAIQFLKDKKLEEFFMAAMARANVRNLNASLFPQQPELLLQ